MKQKEHERVQLEQAIRCGKLDWEIAEEGEAPDFVVCSLKGSFGLELVTVYHGGETERIDRRGPQKFSVGAWSKKREMDRNAKLQKLRRTYEAAGGPPLIVKVFGNILSEDFMDIPRKLEEAGARRLHLGDQVRLDLPCITIHATRAIAAVWILIEDYVGWVHSKPRKEIEAAIAAKAVKLPAYQERVGLDVRLLIIAEDRFKSGKLRPDKDMPFDGRGFTAVYFFNSPSGPFLQLHTPSTLGRGMHI